MVWQDEIRKIHETAVGKSIRPWSTEDVRFLALALCGECGELANMIKKQWRGDAVALGDDIRKELADIMIYHYLLCEALGVDPRIAIEQKLPEIRAKFNVTA